MAAVPALPPELWVRIFGFLRMQHLLVAAPTCSLFRKILAERVREAVNMCLTAARQEWDAEVLQKYAEGASLALFGFNPRTLKALPALAPQADEVNVLLTYFFVPPGQLQSTCFTGTLSRSRQGARHSVNVTERVDTSSPNGIGVMQLCSNASAANQSPFDLEVDARCSNFNPPYNCQEVRNGFGLMLAIARVERQQVVRDDPDSMRLRVDHAWWVAPGYLAITAAVPPGVVPPNLARLPGEGPIEFFDRVDKNVYEGALSDALGVAAALQRCFVLKLRHVQAALFTAHSTQCRCP